LIPEAVIFCGIQASGKSSFFKTRFFRTHVHISLDLLRTRRREKIFLEACLNSRQRFVVDNTNPTRANRDVYIQAARQQGFRIVGYYFASTVEDALVRNAGREGVERVPDKAIFATLSKLERPSPDEGFDALFRVNLHQGEFMISEWRDEI
jgi:predicted kinase